MCIVGRKIRDDLNNSCWSYTLAESWVGQGLTTKMVDEVLVDVYWQDPREGLTLVFFLFLAILLYQCLVWKYY